MRLRQSPSGPFLEGTATGQVPVWNPTTRLWEIGFPILTVPYASWYRAGAQTYSALRFMGFFNQIQFPTEIGDSSPFTRDCVIKNFRLSLVSGVIATQPFIATVRINQADTALATTVAVGQSRAENTSVRVNVLANDNVSISVAGNGSVVPSNMYGRFDVEYESSPS